MKNGIDMPFICIDEARPGLDRSEFILCRTYGGTLEIEDIKCSIGQLSAKEIAEKKKVKFFDYHYKKKRW